MKKLNKVSKTVVLSTIAALAFGGIALTTTYALFTSEANTNVTVTSGKVNVSTDVVLTGAKTLVEGEEQDVTGATENKVTFGCGGTATVDGSEVKLDNIVAGDYVTVKVTAKNSSNVNIKYRLVVTNNGDDEFNKIVTLEGKAGDDAMKKSATGLFTKYQTAVATDTETTLETYTLTFGIDKDTQVTDGLARNGTVSIKLEAIQGNAATKEISEYFVSKSANDLINTISTADSGSTIEVDSPMSLSDTVAISKDINFVLAESVTAPADKNAFNVTDGATLTIGTKATSSSTQTAKGANRNTVDGTEEVPSITSTNKTAIIADGGNVVINSGNIVSEKSNGVAAVNGGSVTVNGGYVKAQEVALLAYKNGSITVNGGTFETVDNFVVGTNGTNGWGGNTITINGGTFNGNIESKNYIACGVYVANSDTVTINKGTFNIEDGCGVLARSGTTTVSDDVVFNFTSSVTDEDSADDKITDGWVGDTKILVPTGKAVVKDLIASYPGGVPTVTYTGTKGVTELKSLDVTTDAEFTSAIANTEVPKNIHILNDITLASRVTIQSKNAIIYGNGNVNITTPDSRVFNVLGDDDEGSYPIVNNGSLTLSGVNIEAKNDNDPNYSRGISFYGTTNYTLNLDNADIKVGHYGIHLAGENSDLTISAKNSTITAYSSLNVYFGNNNNVIGTFNNCVLNGENVYEKADPDNNCANINICSKGNDLSFNGCTFNMNSVQGNKQRIITVYEKENTVTMNKCKFYSINSEGTKEVKTTDTDFVANYLNSSAWITIDGKKY